MMQLEIKITRLSEIKKIPPECINSPSSTKGGLISESFQFLLTSPKMDAKSIPLGG